MDVNEAAQTIADLVQPKGDNGLLVTSFEEVIQKVYDEGQSEGWHDGYDEGNAGGWEEGYERGLEVGAEDD